MKKKDFWLEQIRKNNKQGGNWNEERRGRGGGECKKNQKVNKGCLLESCEIFLATFSSRKFFFAQQFLPIK